MQVNFSFYFLNISVFEFFFRLPIECVGVFFFFIYIVRMKILKTGSIVLKENSYNLEIIEDVPCSEHGTNLIYLSFESLAPNMKPSIWSSTTDGIEEVK